MRLALIIVLFTMLACSTSTKKTKVIDFSDETYAWIENDDFIPPVEVKYEPADDKFDSSHDSLSHESISRLPTKKLDNYESSDEPTAKFLSMCYNKKFDQAKKVSQQIYRKYKSHPTYWNKLGTCYFLQGKYKKALLFYNKSRDINNSYAPAINNLGVLYQIYGDNQKAFAAYKEAYKKRKSSLTPLYNLASLYLKYGHVENAKKLFTLLHKKNDDDIDVLYALGTAYMMEGNFKKAVDVFEDLDDHLTNPSYGLNYIVALHQYKGSKASQKYFADLKQANNLTQIYYNKVRSFIGL